MISYRSKLVCILAVLPGMSSVLAGSALAQEAGGALAFQASIKQELIKRDPPCYRAYLTAGMAKLTFLVPDHYVVTHTPNLKELNLSHRQHGSIALFWLGSLPSTPEGLSADACRTQVAGLYPGATISEESSKPAGGHGNRVYDL